MARVLRKGELWSHVTQCGVIREQTAVHGDTTVKTGAGGVAGVSTLPVTAFANFTNGDECILSDGELMEFTKINNTPADPMPLKYPLFRNHTNPETFKEAGARIVLGDLTDDGVTAGISGGDFTAVRMATQRLVQAYLIGHIEEMIEFKVENWNVDNICAALGIVESNITGAGSAASPYRIIVDGSLLGGASGVPILQMFYFTGATKGGGTVEIQAWGSDVDPTGFSAQYQRGNPAALPFRIRPVAGISFEQY